MKPSRTWLHAALRAHQIHTLDNQHRARDAWQALLEAAEHERHAAAHLGELSAAWVTQRDAGGLDAAMDAMYRQFHGHLRQQTDMAAQAREGCDDRWEKTKAELQRTHSTQRLLERTAQRVEDGQRREVSAREAQATVEAWTFGRCNGDFEAPLRGDGSDVSDSSGGESDFRAR